MQGKSLAGYILGNNELSSPSIAYSVTSGGRAASIQTKQWRYTRWGENIEELYDHQTDPEEHINLAQSPQHQDKLAEMRGEFELVRKRARKQTFPESIRKCLKH